MHSFAITAPCLPYLLHISNACWWLVVLTASNSRVWIFFGTLRFSFWLNLVLLTRWQGDEGRCKRCCHRWFKCHGDELLVLILFDRSCTAWQWADTSSFSSEVSRKRKSTLRLCAVTLTDGKGRWCYLLFTVPIGFHHTLVPAHHPALTHPALFPFPLTGTWKALVLRADKFNWELSQTQLESSDQLRLPLKKTDRTNEA